MLPAISITGCRLRSFQDTVSEEEAVKFEKTMGKKREHKTEAEAKRALKNVWEIMKNGQTSKNGGYVKKYFERKK